MSATKAADAASATAEATIPLTAAAAASAKAAPVVVKKGCVFDGDFFLRLPRDLTSDVYEFVVHISKAGSGKEQSLSFLNHIHGVKWDGKFELTGTRARTSFSVKWTAFVLLEDLLLHQGFSSVSPKID